MHKIKFVDKDFNSVANEIEETLLSDEVARKYAAYSFYTIGDRALADIVDGLKPVQRRILYSMFKSGLTPNKSHTKSARVVGDTMGKYHPHGDTSIYDALVRLAQNHVYPAQLIDGQGNFGAPGISAAAPRYTECRLSEYGQLLTSELSDHVVDMIPNFDDSLEEPIVLPAQIPTLIINGTSGIAVAMASSMAPHNPLEAINACLYQLRNQEQWKAVDEAEDTNKQKQATAKLVKNLMKKIPGPDFPTGGKILGIEGAEDAYTTGSGKIILQSTYTVTPESRGKHKIVFTGFPYGVSPSGIIKQLRENEEKFIKSTRILKENGGKGKIEGFQIEGILSVDDYADVENAAQLVVMVDAKTNPKVVVAELLKRTMLETAFNFNNNCLVRGTPKVVSLPEMIQHFLNSRRRIVKRRAEREQEKKQARLHIIEGLLKVLLDIDKAIKIIRAAESQEAAAVDLKKSFKIDDEQAKYVLDTPLRRLTKFDSLELNEEKDNIKDRLKTVAKMISDHDYRDSIVEDELIAILNTLKKDEKNKRKSEIVDGSLAEYVEEQTKALSMSREVEDEEMVLTLDNGKLYKSKRSIGVSSIKTSTLGQCILVTNKGRGLRVPVIDISSGAAHKGLETGERVVGISDGEHDMVLGTKKGVVFAYQPNYPTRFNEFPIVNLQVGDEVLLAKDFSNAEQSEVVFVSSDSSLLHFSADKVASKATLNGKGMAGMKLSDGSEVIEFNVLNPVEVNAAIVTTYTGSTLKQTNFSDFPAKGRATYGVRAHKFLKGEDHLERASIGVNPITVIDDEKHGPEFMGRRDGSGIKVGEVSGIKTSIITLSE